MTIFRPFFAIRPSKDLAPDIAALPYDVYSTEEARAVYKNAPHSFLQIDRPEILFPDGTDAGSAQVYEKARDTMASMLSEGQFINDPSACYYIYELTMNGHVQTGLVGCASIDEYKNGTIKRHENTRPEKELDRCRHIDTLNAQTGPIFLAYRANESIRRILQTVQQDTPLYQFTAQDQVLQTIWRIDDPSQIAALQHLWADVPCVYIADGHHRAASAVKVGEKRRERSPSYRGDEPFNFFLSVLFPDDQLQILAYNRVVLDLNGHTAQELLTLLQTDFQVRSSEDGPVHPSTNGTFGMYLQGQWYHLTAHNLVQSGNPAEALDVSVLQNRILDPLLGITDPGTSPRIHFVGGIRGLAQLEEEVDARGDGVAFSMYPTSLSELFSVADEGLLMPPKSTWFEPKLRSGLFIRKI